MKRATRTQLRDLIRRVGIERLAARFDRTPATIKRWLHDIPVSARAEIAGAYERSERARAAAAKRQAEREAKEAAERLKRERQAERAREVAATRRFEKFRKEQGPEFDGRTSGGHASLRAMISSDDPVWQAFLAFAESQGRTRKGAFDAWFSPKLKKKSAGRRRKAKKKKSTSRKVRKKTRR